MRSSLRTPVQRLVIRTSFFPLVHLYGAAYALSVKVAALLLRRVDGVAAIYLRRGLAKGEAVYGLSDIDLSVIVEDGDGERNDAKEKVRTVYDRLARFIPLFGDGDMELGVYSVAEVSRLYEDYGFNKYRFHEGRHTWRLLFGRDVVRSLPQPGESDLRRAAGEELKKWWGLVGLDLFGDACRRLFESRYLWYKAIAEASKVYLHVCHGVTLRGREEALDRVGGGLSPSERQLVDRVRGYLKHLAAEEDVPREELMRLFVSLAAASFREIDLPASSASDGVAVVARVPDPEDLALDGAACDLREALERDVRQVLGDHIDSVALVPRVEFSLDVLSNSDIDALCLVLFPRGPVPLEKLGRFVALLEETQYATRLEPFFVVDGSVAFSLKVDKVRKWAEIKSRGTCPLFFAMLGDRPSGTDDGAGPGSGRLVRCHLPRNMLEETLRKREARIDAILSGRDVYKMKILDFLRFFWGAARSKLACRSLAATEVAAPLTSRQVLDQLEEYSPGDSGWLAVLHGEYVRELRGEESEAFRFVSTSIDLLRRM